MHYSEIDYEVAKERMQEQMRRAAIWRTQRAAMDARRQSVTSTAQADRNWISTLTHAFTAWKTSKRDEIPSSETATRFQRPA